jgi:dTDP-4-amino-4,6-dideoxygalactose transaminase
LESICKRYSVPLVFDAAHALGCGGFGRSTGSFGAAEVFSLHATKICQSFEGGVITTNDGDLAKRLRAIRNFGFSGYDQVDGLGTNAKMSEISAGMGQCSLDSLSDYIAVNRQNFVSYKSLFANIPGITLIDYPSTQVSNFQYVVAEVNPEMPLDSRDLLCAALHAEGILVRRYFFPGCHHSMPYKLRQETRHTQLLHTESLCARVLCFPTGTAVMNTDIEIVSSLTREILASTSLIREFLASRK